MDAQRTVYKCLNCCDVRWVCEDHPHEPWDPSEGCKICGGAGAACKLCNTGSPPDMPPGFKVIVEVGNENAQ
jgi:hypothetical protein